MKREMVVIPRQSEFPLTEAGCRSRFNLYSGVPRKNALVLYCDWSTITTKPSTMKFQKVVESGTQRIGRK